MESRRDAEGRTGCETTRTRYVESCHEEGEVAMAIERDPNIKFHEQGTLNSVTRWIASHDEGLAEWFKNVRRAYLSDRADVSEENRAAVLLLRDESDSGPARIGLLDVGGATLEDVTAWSTWQDPEASGRSSGVVEEETQGNGGKAYMYRLFRGPARILGVREGKRNAKGFEGPTGSVERGTPGFVPDAAAGREVPIASFDKELELALAPYGVEPADLPTEVLDGVYAREAFTLVEGVDPPDLYRGRIDAEELVRKTIRHEQSTLALQQLHIYAMHNGYAMAGGAPLELPPIPPYPELEGPFTYEIPEELPLASDQLVSTTEGGSRPKGRLILFTSADHMHLAYKNLRPRWKIVYRTTHTMVGSKPVSDFAPATPGAAFIYGVVELEALEPGYVGLGRLRPKDGPLVEAVDLFTEGQIKQLAREISDRRREDLDEQALDEVQDENRKLDEFKNRFLSEDGAGAGGGMGEGEEEGPAGPPPPPPPEFGTEPDTIELTVPDPALRIGRGVKLHLKRVLHARVQDDLGRAVPAADLEWFTDDGRVAAFETDDVLVGVGKGQTTVWAKVKGENIESPRVPIDVWVIDHVLLTPRNLEIPLGKRERIVAEATSDEGERATDVYLTWAHDAEDPMIIRIRPNGTVTGNRTGRTAITAGSGDPGTGGVWSRIPVEVSVIPNPEEPRRGSGFPRLLLTGRDIDPGTDEVREGDPDAPCLWQEPADYIHNVWWLNLQSSEAAFAFGQRDENALLWRHFHVGRVMDMVTQVLMQDEFTRRGEDEREAYWADHKQALDRHQVQTIQQMWEALDLYVKTGGGLE
jgi:hypothetical protein